MAKESDLLLANQLNIMGKKTNFSKNNKRTVAVDGFMTFDELENGLRIADFECCEKVEVEAFTARCKVQVVRDGNVYITEIPKRVRNKPMFRDDNCSLSLGQDGKYYFVFSLPEQLVDELPEQLVRQASAIAQKVLREIICR